MTREATAHDGQQRNKLVSNYPEDGYSDVPQTNLYVVATCLLSKAVETVQQST